MVVPLAVRCIAAAPGAALVLVAWASIIQTRDPADAWPDFVGWRVNYEQAAYAIAYAITAALPAGSVIGGMSALTWQYPSDQAARPCGQRRGGSEGGRGVDPAEHRLHRADLSDTWYSLTAGTMLQRGASC